MKITTDLLKQQLPDFDTQSVVTSKTFKGMNLKKKDKKKLRHDLWMESKLLCLFEVVLYPPPPQKAIC